MAVSVQLHNLIASLTNASKKGDLKAVAKWAREIAALTDPAPVATPAVAPSPTPVDPLAGDFSVQPADPPEVVFDPSTWPPLALAPGTVRMGKYGEVFGSAIPASNVYTDLQTSGGYDGSTVPPMFYLFLRGKIIYAQEGNVDPVERIRLKTLYRPANTTGLTF